MGQSRRNLPQEGDDLIRAPRRLRAFAGPEPQESPVRPSLRTVGALVSKSPEGAEAAESLAYDRALPPAQDDVEYGRLLFAGHCRFLWAAASLAQLPPPGAPEIAFTGRSNVGKSSLLNALTNRKNLARTSRAPGRTRELNFFALENKTGEASLRLVDMPGYGFAAAAKTKIAAWTDLAQSYLRGRATLLRVFVLIDGRHGIKDIDREMLDLLDQAAVSYEIILTKRDEVRKADQAARIEATMHQLATQKAAYPDVIFTSARTGEGLVELRAGIARLLKDHGERPPSGASCV